MDLKCHCEEPVSTKQSHKENKLGFTLIELLVVLIIIGVLAGVAVPKYTKTIETSKADEAYALVQTVYAANRMYVINNCPWGLNCYCTGAIDTNGCTVPGPAISLVTLSYVPNLNTPARSYRYCAADAVSAAAGQTRAALARRLNGTDDFATWGYEIKASGAICAYGTNVPRPSDVSCCSGDWPTCSSAALLCP
ncbi:MAG: prepilin-type N-terminal cleavage/methylation domain-containing protein [Elusimicrobia bacterium]|nr:prepilin-type N-terminal cleavage/methylation domain-containing protein [Elusimicrobiota bacterium]